MSLTLFAHVYLCLPSVLGPALGPIAGGFLGAAAGWRWVEALLGIFAGLLTILGILFIPETVSLVGNLLDSKLRSACDGHSTRSVFDEACFQA